MNLVAFLTARFDEDAVLAQAYIRGRERAGTDRETWAYKLLLADIDAKRRIIALHTPEPYDFDPPIPALGDPPCPTCAAIPKGYVDPEWQPWPCPTLCYLALPYADHPDYQETWRP